MRAGFVVVRTAAGADEQLLSVDQRGVEVGVEPAGGVDLRVAHVRAEGRGLSADRAGTWHQRITSTKALRDGVADW